MHPYRGTSQYIQMNRPIQEILGYPNNLMFQSSKPKTPPRYTTYSLVVKITIYYLYIDLL